MFRNDDGENKNSSMEDELKLLNLSIKKAAEARAEMAALRESVTKTLAEVDEKINDVKKEAQAKSKPNASSSGLFKREQQNSNHQEEPQDEPKPKKGKGGCTIL